ncbi:MAG: hypothetical protein WDW36_001735 [Sanguina aurantia]
MHAAGRTTTEPAYRMIDPGTASLRFNASSPMPMQQQPQPLINVKVILSYGGTFSCCNAAGSWEHSGGQTRLLTVDQSFQFPRLLQYLCAATGGLIPNPAEACLKYDLLSCPGVLVDVKNDEDVTNMWEELEEVTGCSGTPHRLHIFLDKLSSKGHSMSGHEPGQHEAEGFTSRTPSLLSASSHHDQYVCTAGLAAAALELQLSQKLSSGGLPDTIPTNNRGSPFPHQRVSREESHAPTSSPAQEAPTPADGPTLTAADGPKPATCSVADVARAVGKTLGYAVPKPAGYEPPTSVMYRAGSRAAWIQDCEDGDPGSRGSRNALPAAKDVESRSGRAGAERSMFADFAGGGAEGTFAGTGQDGTGRHQCTATEPGGHVIVCHGASRDSPQQTQAGQQQGDGDAQADRQQRARRRERGSQQGDEQQQQQRVRSRRGVLEERMASGTAVMDVDGSINVNLTIVPRRSPRMLAELMSAVRGQVEVMSPSDLHIVKYIGSGGYGDVYLARWHGTDVAVKSLAVGAADEEGVANVLLQAFVLARMRHPNLVNLYAVVLDPEEEEGEGGVGGRSLSAADRPSNGRNKQPAGRLPLQAAADAPASLTESDEVSAPATSSTGRAGTDTSQGSKAQAYMSSPFANIAAALPPADATPTSHSPKRRHAHPKPPSITATPANSAASNSASIAATPPGRPAARRSSRRRTPPLRQRAQLDHPPRPFSNSPSPAGSPVAGADDGSSAGAAHAEGGGTPGAPVQAAAEAAGAPDLAAGLTGTAAGPGKTSQAAPRAQAGGSPSTDAAACAGPSAVAAATSAGGTAGPASGGSCETGAARPGGADRGCQTGTKACEEGTGGHQGVAQGHVGPPFGHLSTEPALAQAGRSVAAAVGLTIANSPAVAEAASRAVADALEEVAKQRGWDLGSGSGSGSSRLGGEGAGQASPDSRVQGHTLTRTRPSPSTAPPASPFAAASGPTPSPAPGVSCTLAPCPPLPHTATAALADPPTSPPLPTTPPCSAESSPNPHQKKYSPFATAPGNDQDASATLPPSDASTPPFSDSLLFSSASALVSSSPSRPRTDPSVAWAAAAGAQAVAAAAAAAAAEKLGSGSGDGRAGDTGAGESADHSLVTHCKRDSPGGVSESDPAGQAVRLIHPGNALSGAAAAAAATTAVDVGSATREPVVGLSGQQRQTQSEPGAGLPIAAAAAGVEEAGKLCPSGGRTTPPMGVLEEENSRILACNLVRCPALVTEYLSGTSVRGALRRKAEFILPALSRARAALDGARGLEYLHHMGLIHFNFKTGNLLVSFQERQALYKMTLNGGIAVDCVHAHTRVDDTIAAVWVAQVADFGRGRPRQRSSNSISPPTGRPSAARSKHSAATTSTATDLAATAAETSAIRDLGYRSDPNHTPVTPPFAKLLISATTAPSALDILNPAVTAMDLKPNNAATAPSDDLTGFAAAGAAAAATAAAAAEDEESLSRRRSLGDAPEGRDAVIALMRRLEGLGRCLPWTAPEILFTPQHVTEKVDCYSFGMVMWSLWTLREPYDNMAIADMMQMLALKPETRPPLPGTPEWPSSLGSCPAPPAPGWAALMQSCWDHDPTARPAFREVVLQLQEMVTLVTAAKVAAMHTAATSPV